MDFVVLFCRGTINKISITYQKYYLKCNSVFLTSLLYTLTQHTDKTHYMLNI